MRLTIAAINAAVAAHGGPFFDCDLRPVVPVVGQWFCEYSQDCDYEGRDRVRDEALVEYLGPDEQHTFGPNGLETRTVHIVAEDGGDCRQPREQCLILQS